MSIAGQYDKVFLWHEALGLFFFLLSQPIYPSADRIFREYMQSKTCHASINPPNLSGNPPGLFPGRQQHPRRMGIFGMRIRAKTFRKYHRQSGEEKGTVHTSFSQGQNKLHSLPCFFLDFHSHSLVGFRSFSLLLSPGYCICEREGEVSHVRALEQLPRYLRTYHVFNRNRSIRICTVSPYPSCSIFYGSCSRPGQKETAFFIHSALQMRYRTQGLISPPPSSWALLHFPSSSLRFLMRRREIERTQCLTACKL